MQSCLRVRLTGLVVCTWQVIFSNEWDSSTGRFGWDGIGKRVGGSIAPLGDSVGLRVLIDHSLVEVFTDSGHALTTRSVMLIAICTLSMIEFCFSRLLNKPATSISSDGPVVLPNL